MGRTRQCPEKKSTRRVFLPYIVAWIHTCTPTCIHAGMMWRGALHSTHAVCIVSGALVCALPSTLAQGLWLQTRLSQCIHSYIRVSARASVVFCATRPGQGSHQREGFEDRASDSPHWSQSWGRAQLHQSSPSMPTQATMHDNTCV